MYGKIFESIYKGTLYGQWEAIVTFQQLIVLCDKDGIIDMTPPAIAATTSIPLDIIEKGINALQEEDPYSRSPKEKGKRIILIDEDRPWGWQIVNYEYYRDLANREDKKEKDRLRIAEKRNKNKSVAECSILSQEVADVAHININTNANINKETTLSGKPDDKKQKFKKDAAEIISFLNEKTGRNYQPVDANTRMIISRMKEGATVTQIRQVIAKKCREWHGRDNMQEYLRPKTLFNATNFANYVGELGERRVEE